MLIRQCLNCQKDILKIRNYFCNRSCSASYHNRINPKRKGKKYVEKFCDCSNIILTRHKFCKECRDKKRHHKFGCGIEEVKLELFLQRKRDASRFAAIRANARTITANREQKCKCGYDKHVETCHIKDIADFLPENTIGEINHPDNLILLCPNCHWEFDNIEKRE